VKWRNHGSISRNGCKRCPFREMYNNAMWMRHIQIQLHASTYLREKYLAHIFTVKRILIYRVFQFQTPHQYIVIEITPGQPAKTVKTKMVQSTKYSLFLFIFSNRARRFWQFDQRSGQYSVNIDNRVTSPSSTFTVILYIFLLL